MRVQYNIAYQTVFGEDLILNIIHGKTGHKESISRYRMSTNDGLHWTCEVNSQDERGAVEDYYYSVERDGCEVRCEWKTIPHRLELTGGKNAAYTVYDHWVDMPEDSYRYTTVFSDCIYHRERTPMRASTYSRTLRIKVRAPQLRAGETLVISGDVPTLGSWNLQKAVRMTEHNINEWVVNLDASKLKTDTVELKFAVVSDAPDFVPFWEEGLNRKISIPSMKSGEITVYELPQAFFPIPNTRCAGTLVPVFSLRSAGSFGVGDFGDLKQMIDWVSSTRQRVLQLLPINDTTITHTWTDSYPYSCISIYALHPQFVDLRSLPALKDKVAAEHFNTLQNELNGLDKIDYERVNEAKTAYLRLLFDQEGSRMMSTQGFKNFFEEEQYWLVPYARYCHLRDTEGTADFSRWKGNEQWKEADRAALSSPRTKAYKEVAFYYFVQYILDRQMADAHTYARNRGVVLKGDIPIGVNRYSCDVWQEPEYFHLNGQAGAPPDGFSANGQNWGFPTYNWEAMLKDGCRWWIRRFSNMAKYFDAYRIDHVLGFFRIWEIPSHAVHGLLGQFAPALGMTREEIEAYGLHWQEELFTQPFIMDWVLERIFKEHADEVRRLYVVPTHDGRYKMHPDYDTQRKVEAAFEGKTSDKDIWIRDGLYALISDVLFVRDHRDTDKFHPRISVQLDFIYESLYDSDKFVFNKLYNDYYYRRNNQFWYYEAMKKLPILVQATRMMACAEDLGMVPDCVSWVMNELKILSLELQSMPKNPDVRFGILAHNPYRSVCTISSHDMPTLRQWWDEDINRTQAYYNTVLYRGGAAPHPLPGWLARDIVAQHLACPSMLCILSIQDWMAIDESLRLNDPDAERINIPANPKHYWRYRMHVSLEDLMERNDFNYDITNLIAQSGR
ncbi:MAG: 4-alpha-glucanotransferase [Hoylesella marshii]|uniref:4-alpha-glucanotransferase n=1 Tax=Hoylesella marshii TaxID=189722 RepID=UPI003FA00987